MQKIFSEDSIRFTEQDQEIAAIREETGEGKVTFFLTGSLNSETANDLADEMAAMIISGQEILLNMEEVTYLASSVMEALLRMEKKLEEKGKFMQILRMPQKIYDDFKARGMHELFEIEVIKK